MSKCKWLSNSQRYIRGDLKKNIVSLSCFFTFTQTMNNSIFTLNDREYLKSDKGN
ncbi:MAG: hypothetical protein ACI9LM_002953 [Alteromonadaceae bacterium]|jgi:hypothetical protein